MDNSQNTLNAYLCLSCIALLSWHSLSVAESAPTSEASVQTPGADLANFPNSAFTLPQGRAYIELTPVNYNSRSRNDSPSQYSAGYLLRYGLTDNVELRLLSTGYTWIDDTNKTEGMSPQTLDFKWHIMDEQPDFYLPAMGIEVAVQTNLASRVFKNGWKPGLSLNFDQTLPYDIAIEYNLGFVTQQTDNGKTQYQLALSWAVQRQIFTDVAAFVNGYTNTANGLTNSAVGAGLQWIPAQRLALFTNISTGLTANIPKVSILTGLTIAF